LLIAVFVFLSAMPGARECSAQAYDASQARHPVDLGEAKWLFHPGDAPSWSQPGLDDSGWQVVDPAKQLSTYADAAHGRVFWYRLHVQIDPTMADPALGAILVARAYSIYANGQLLTQVGRSPGHEVSMFSPPAVYHLTQPRSGLNSRDPNSNSLVIAVRCILFDSARDLPRPLVAPGKLLLGRFEELEQRRELHLLSVGVPYWSLLTLEITVGLLALALYRTQRQQRDYFWIALLALDQALTTSMASFGDLYPIPRLLAGILAPLLDAGLMLGLLGFYTAFARRRTGPRLDWWARTVCVCAAADFCIGVLNFNTPWMPDSAALILMFLYYSPLTLYPFFSLIQAVREGNREARLMLLPFAFLAVEFYLRVGSALLAGLGAIKEYPAFVNGFTVLYMNLNSRMCVGFLFWFALLALVVLRSNRLSRENARIAAEVEAARQIQQVLLPDPASKVPGFETESVYLPASQVGGDFFQLLPAPGGGLLVIVGDVAGKGLSAAMLVSVLVGAIRAEAAHGTEPATLLAALNRALLGHSGGGFATCLCARIAASGHMTIANAGHLSPYLDGHEQELPGALPLGILPNAEYEPISLQLQPGNRLTFYSDGVPEAQNPSGQLFGFDQARALSTQPAEAIAQAASSYGQTDDITVLTVSFTGSTGDLPLHLAA
jgi:hypothetical protein